MANWLDWGTKPNNKMTKRWVSQAQPNLNNIWLKAFNPDLSFFYRPNRPTGQTG
jgi:hypothetical protein